MRKPEVLRHRSVDQITTYDTCAHPMPTGVELGMCGFMMSSTRLNHEKKTYIERGRETETLESRYGLAEGRGKGYFLARVQ